MNEKVSTYYSEHIYVVLISCGMFYLNIVSDS